MARSWLHCHPAPASRHPSGRNRPSRPACESPLPPVPFAQWQRRHPRCDARARSRPRLPARTLSATPISASATSAPPPPPTHVRPRESWRPLPYTPTFPLPETAPPSQGKTGEVEQLLVREGGGQAEP
ncbi:hypothetical protein I4F81_009343 [Pyropia yezoensis]|uniref:Uncharacterized protein n=1 Tax=Pyropia yezoensis TaxID=2788 RepID=A0ACC3CA25_PYRYE|nr:hypothetical protein I4F81_009343 [Neopyropia yezoensis]